MVAKHFITHNRYTQVIIVVKWGSLTRTKHIEIVLFTSTLNTQYLEQGIDKT